jgi:hypothetical protein
MGVCISTTNNLHNNYDCIICMEQIDDNMYVACIGCPIKLHHECQRNDNVFNNRNYCKCPHCRRVGTLYFSSKT